nr:sesquipedalian-2 isoform X1 [Equus asinus]XP_044634540.1 sesquipedalian-2 isoform X1 [Equus asinus]
MGISGAQLFLSGGRDYTHAGGGWDPPLCSLGRAFWRERAFIQYRGIYSAQKVLGPPYSLPGCPVNRWCWMLPQEGLVAFIYQQKSLHLVLSSQLLGLPSGKLKKRCGGSVAFPGKASLLLWFPVLGIPGAWAQDSWYPVMNYSLLIGLPKRCSAPETPWELVHSSACHPVCTSQDPLIATLTSLGPSVFFSDCFGRQIGWVHRAEPRPAHSSRHLILYADTPDFYLSYCHCVFYTIKTLSFFFITHFGSSNLFQLSPEGCSAWRPCLGNKDRNPCGLPTRCWLTAPPRAQNEGGTGASASSS